MKNTLKLYSLLILTFLTLIPGVHKILGPFPPEWFVGLFKESLINKIPGGMSISFVIIVFIEIVAGLLFLASLFNQEFKISKKIMFSRYAFHLTYILFIVLFFGSFLIQNYDNGFNDFIYFVGVLVIDFLLFRTEEVN